MFIYFIYFVIFLILIFVLVIAVKAITRGIEAKEKNKINLNKEKNIKEDNNGLSSQIKDLNNLYNKGVLTEDEFKKAKEKILK